MVRGAAEGAADADDVVVGRGELRFGVCHRAVVADLHPCPGARPVPRSADRADAGGHRQEAERGQGRRCAPHRARPRVSSHAKERTALSGLPSSVGSWQRLWLRPEVAIVNAALEKQRLRAAFEQQLQEQQRHPQQQQSRSIAFVRCGHLHCWFDSPRPPSMCAGRALKNTVLVLHKYRVLKYRPKLECRWISI